MHTHGTFMHIMCCAFNYVCIVDANMHRGLQYLVCVYVLQVYTLIKVFTQLLLMDISTGFMLNQKIFNS